MAKNELVIHGAGGHGLVVAEAVELGGWSVLGFIDDDPTKRGTPIGRWRVLDRAPDKAVRFVAVGDNAARHRMIQKLREFKQTLASVTHPAAFVSPSAKIGPGVFIGPGAVVHAEAVVGEGAILNTGCIVEHHNHIGVAAHVGPGAVLGGNVTVGQRALVGAGATVLPGLAIGDDAIVGAGSVVLTDIPANGKYAGNPARSLL